MAGIPNQPTGQLKESVLGKGSWRCMCSQTAVEVSCTIRVRKALSDLTIMGY